MIILVMDNGIVPLYDAIDLWRLPYIPYPCRHMYKRQLYEEENVENKTIITNIVNEGSGSFDGTTYDRTTLQIHDGDDEWAMKSEH